MIPRLVIVALTSSFSLGLRILDRKYIPSKIENGESGLVPRFNVVGVPSEARLLYVVDNELSEGGGGADSHVRDRRGKDVMRIVSSV